MAGLRLIVATLALAAVGQAVTPVQKVLTMMNEMKTKGEKMMAEEKSTFAAYKEWVSDTSRQLGMDIETEKSDIEKFTAAATKADSDVSTLGSAIDKLNGELDTTEGEKADATSIRKGQHDEFVKISTDYGESVDALERAIQTMQARSADTPDQSAAAFLQKEAMQKPGMRRVLAAFLQENNEVARGGPAVAAYEFQSGGIVALLEKFLKKFQDELAAVEEEEHNQASNFDLEMINLSNTIDYLKKEIEEKSVLKAKRAKESAQAKADVASTQNELAADEKTLSETEATFAAKSDQFKANQEVRAAELEAIGKAIEIISDPKVAGSYGEHVNLLQGKTSLLQIRSARSRVTARSRVVEFLQRKAAMLSSTALKTLASQVASNPFDKVVKMIQDLVAKLKEEAAAEAEHKQWCDEQLHDNKIKREKKTAKVNKLTATIEAATQDIAAMGKKIQTLKEEQSELTMAMSKATTQRDKEKATNTDTIADAAAGEQATKAALVVLKEFYASQGSFVQQAPEMAAYSGMSSAKGGVVGMLEVISSDFARLHADTTASESAAATEYAAFMKDAKASKDSKHKLEVKTSLKKDQTEFEKGRTTKDLESTQAELDSALGYYENLKPVCLEVHVSYEERVAQRKAEIEALKEAYGVLDRKA
jgi:hypothetical protein